MLLDAEAMTKFTAFADKFKAAGGQGITILINAAKDTDPANAADGIVFLVTKSEDADNDKLKELFAEPMAGAKDKLSPDCPKEIGHTLAWYSAKYKKPKANEDRAAAFSEAYGHLAKDSSVSIVIVPDEEAATLAEDQLKTASPKKPNC